MKSRGLVAPSTWLRFPKFAFSSKSGTIFLFSHDIYDYDTTDASLKPFVFKTVCVFDVHTDEFSKRSHFPCVFLWTNMKTLTGKFAFINDNEEPEC